MRIGAIAHDDVLDPQVPQALLPNLSETDGQMLGALMSGGDNRQVNRIGHGSGQVNRGGFNRPVRAVGTQQESSPDCRLVARECCDCLFGADLPIWLTSLLATNSRGSRDADRDFL